MKNKAFKIGVTDIILLAVSLLFLLGIFFVFGPCGPKDDGSWMTCHWAGNAVKGLAAVLTVIAVIHFVVPDGKIKAGLSMAAIPVALLALLVPDRLIHMCMMDSMRCHAVMAPSVIVFSLLVIAAAGADIFRQIKSNKAN